MQQELVILSSSPVPRDGASINYSVSKPNVWPCDARLKSGQHIKPVPESAASGFQKASVLPRNESPEKTKKGTTHKPRRKKSGDLPAVGDDTIDHENVVVKRRGRPKKNSSTSTTKPKVIKPKTPRAPKASKVPAAKLKDVALEDKENVSTVDLTDEPATKRRMTWTPPPAGAGAVESGTPSKAAVDFKDAVTNMSFVDTKSKAPPRRSKEIIPLKRKRIELVKSSETLAEKNKTSKKASPNKKPKTIIELATAKYTPTDVTQDEDNTAHPETTPPPNPKGKGKKTKKELKPKLLSPATLLIRTGAQRLSFGTSSQLMFPETGQYLRELQKALGDSKSEVSFSDVVHTSIEIDSRRFRKANITSMRSAGIWDAGATSSAQNLFDRIEQNLMNATPRPPIVLKISEAAERDDQEKPSGDLQPMSSIPPTGLDSLTANDSDGFHAVDDVLDGSDLNREHSLGFIPVDDLINSVPPPEASASGNDIEYNFTIDDHPLEICPAYPVSFAQGSTTPPERWLVASSNGKQLHSNMSLVAAEFVAVDDLLHSEPKSDPALGVSQFFPKKKLIKKKDSLGFVPVDEVLQKISPVGKIKARKKRATTKKGKKASKEFIPIDEIVDSEPDFTPSPPRLDKPLKLTMSPQKKNRKQLQEEAWDRTRSTVFKSITSLMLNTEWHERILMYQPIILEDFTEWLQDKGLKMIDESTNEPASDCEIKPWMIRQWCESKSICCLWRLTNRKTVRKA